MRWRVNFSIEDAGHIWRGLQARLLERGRGCDDFKLRKHSAHCFGRRCDLGANSACTAFMQLHVRFAALICHLLAALAFAFREDCMRQEAGKLRRHCPKQGAGPSQDS